MPKFGFSNRSYAPGGSSLTTRDRIQFTILGLAIVLLAVFVFFPEKGAGPATLPAPAPVAAARVEPVVPAKPNLPPQPVLNANPNPVRVCDGGGGTTMIEFAGSRPGMYAIHLDSPGGPLFARFSDQGASTTGKWVTDGMRFVAVEESTGKVVASVLVRTTSSDCRPTRRRLPMNFGADPRPG